MWRKEKSLHIVSGLNFLSAGLGEEQLTHSLVVKDLPIFQKNVESKSLQPQKKQPIVGLRVRITHGVAQTSSGIQIVAIGDCLAGLGLQVDGTLEACQTSEKVKTFTISEGSLPSRSLVGDGGT